MKSLKVTLQRARSGSMVDLAVTMEPGLTVGALADALDARDPDRQAAAVAEPHTLAVLTANGSQALPSSDPVDTSGVLSGAMVSLLPATAHFAHEQSRRQAGVIELISGPGAPQTFPLFHGVNTIGREPGCTVILADKQVSKRHARVIVDELAEIVDDGSTNGVLIGGGPVSRKVLTPTDRITLGDSVIAVQLAVAPGAKQRSAEGRRGQVPFNRSPRLDPPYDGVVLESPAPPRPPGRRRLPVVPMLMPILMGAVLYMVTRSPLSIIFVALSPLMLFGSYFEENFAQRRAMREAAAAFRAGLAELDADLQKALETERIRRHTAHPAVADLVREAMRYGPLLWTRRPEHRSFLDLRLGLGTVPSRNSVRMPSGAERDSPMLEELKAIVAPYATIGDVPVVAALKECGALGIAGHSELAAQVAWSVVVQLAILHSPAEVVLTAVMSGESARRWDWLKWLPHTSPHPLSAHTPIRAPHLTTGGDGAVRLTAELDSLIAQRTAASSGHAKLPAVVLLVTDDTDVDRAVLVDIAERGPAAGVHVIWCAPVVELLPASCRTFLTVDTAMTGGAGFVLSGEEVAPLKVEPLVDQAVHTLARRLSPVIDSAARVVDESGLPTSVSLVSAARTPIDSSPHAIIDRWSESRSITQGPYAVGPDPRHEPHLRALVGAIGVDEPFHLDLRSQGPHALVGGITGAGKSELLQSWLLGIATAHSPQRATFLLVDYKGGSAFGACSALPHCIGLVTDLDPRLVQRALTSLRAELTRREKLISRHQVKDLVDLEKNHPSQAAPRLVIVVDEFAALKKEIPEFVDGLVDIAQRGRSLGLHLILATQRPTGVISDNLRANTNLRVALRMADETDSTDVLGVPLAAGFDPDIPGRAAARTGPGRLVTFQAAYAGGWTTSEPPTPRVVVSTLPFGVDRTWDRAPQMSQAPVRDPGANDVTRIVRNVGRAFELIQVKPPRKPWLPQLPQTIDFDTLMAAERVDDDAEAAESGYLLAFGGRDLPEKQAQPLACFALDTRGNLAVYGTGGTGKSTLLRTLAFAAASGQAGPAHIYGIDAGGRGLDMLEVLPQVAPIVRSEDTERVVRLLDRLRSTIEQRQGLFNEVQADTIGKFWDSTAARGNGSPWAHPRILLLIDGIATFLQRYQPGNSTGVFERLLAVASAGRPVGVHLILSADRPGAIPGSLAAAVQSRVVLRLAGDNDYASLGLRRDAIDPAAPPGRGLMGTDEVQVAVPGGADLTVQRGRLELLAKASSQVPRPAQVKVLGTQIPLSSLSRQGLRDEPLAGVDAESLSPVTFRPQGFFVVAGPGGSGRTTTLTTLAVSLRGWRPSARLFLLAKANTALLERSLWTSHWTDAESALEGIKKELSDMGTEQTMLMVDNVPAFVAEKAFLPLLTACREAHLLVIADCELGTIQTHLDAYKMLCSNRSGLALQPTFAHGQVFGADMNRLPRPPEPPPGRALLFDRGAGKLIQLALPD